jgi:hypothetical protein
MAKRCLKQGCVASITSMLLSVMLLMPLVLFLTMLMLLTLGWPMLPMLLLPLAFRGSQRLVSAFADIPATAVLLNAADVPEVPALLSLLLLTSLLLLVFPMFLAPLQLLASPLLLASLLWLTSLLLMVVALVLPCPFVSCAAVSPSIAVVLSAVNVPGVPAVARVFALAPLLLLASELLLESLTKVHISSASGISRPTILTAVVSSLESLLRLQSLLLMLAQLLFRSEPVPLYFLYGENKEYTRSMSRLLARSRPWSIT